MENYIKHHGLPRSIISDRDSRFMSKFWRAVFQKFGTKLQPSTAFHPQTDGQTERTNQTLEQLLHCTLEGTADWDLQLPILELSYNTSVSTSAGSTPYKIVYGREALTPLDVTPTKDERQLRITCRNLATYGVPHTTIFYGHRRRRGNRPIRGGHLANSRKEKK